MSDVTPPQGPDQPVEPTIGLGDEPTAELAGALPSPDAPPITPYVPPARRSNAGRTLTILSITAVVVVAILCGGAYAVYLLINGGGPRPADVLPSSTVAVISVDLNPSASQKISAITTIRKFPSLRKRLGLNSTDDLRKYAFDKLVVGSCSGLDFDRDLKPWIGDRAALAAVDLGDKTPAPALVLQITDPAKARTGFKTIAACDHSGDLGWAVGKDYLIASDSTAHAQKILLAGEKSPLASDPAYQKWTSATGDAGVVNFYVAKKAVSYLSDLIDSFSSSLGQGFSSGLSGGLAPGLSGNVPGSSGASARIKGDGSDPGSLLTSGLKNFQGLAGTIRFSGGGMELAYATSSTGTAATEIGTEVGALPHDTAIALGFAMPKGYAQSYLNRVKGLGGSASDAIGQAERATGLSFPQDLTDLLGSGVTLSLGGTAPPDLNNLRRPEDLPFGIVLHTDAAKGRAVITKLEDHLGFQLSDIPLTLGGTSSELVLSPSPAYASALSKSGSLGETAAFKDAVPHADESGAIAYIDFNSAWRTSLVNLIKDLGGTRSDVDAAKANTDPLRSLGYSSWVDSSNVSHGLLRLTTD
ncbi:MAG: hypothetical protein JWR52_418 [Marmoricola sp.]|nr:hypothetical protein [Marmoricola sp.]